ncbi:hypothetical protein [Tatumella citrea]|uniref:hypothetical protein n=1 Tax=Tatumella citrea TaxID=53336 RepID=UPI0012FCF33F|nr:hypothetical protein [Tatumella citrea]
MNGVQAFAKNKAARWSVRAVNLARVTGVKVRLMVYPVRIVSENLCLLQQHPADMRPVSGFSLLIADS